MGARGVVAPGEGSPDAGGGGGAWPEKALAWLGGLDRATYIAVIPKAPKLDDGALTAARAAQPPYTGAMGSRRAQEKRRDFTVDWVHLKLNDQAQRTVLCKDPFRAYDERVERLIASM